LEGYDIQMPVVFDTEPIYYDDSRTDELTPDKLTAIVRAFCDRIKEHGYTPMIYANAKRLTCMLHLERLSDIALWYADYQEAPIYPYEYQMWQYTEHGSVDGIDGEVDLNVYFGM
jgi:GH25 family lysozyme M1 (1,4-beta-N-acetylmuramidase)